MKGLYVKGLYVKGLYVKGLYVKGLYVKGLYVKGLYDAIVPTFQDRLTASLEPETEAAFQGN